MGEPGQRFKMWRELERSRVQEPLLAHCSRYTSF